VDVREASQNVLLSPFPKKAPNVDHKLKTVTVKLRDSLLPNTTYTVNFGSAIADLNEGNVLKDFNFVFSTGPVIDSLSLSGKIILAESGKTDSTVIAMLYRNADDSAVQKRKPDYISYPNGKGEFRFNNLPAGKFKLYALQDGDGGKTYNSPVEIFGFTDNDVTVSANTAAQTIYAFAKETDQKTLPATSTRTLAADKKFRFSTSVDAGPLGLLNDLFININRPLKAWDTAKIILTDTNYIPVKNTSIKYDTATRKFVIKNNLPQDTRYRLIVNKEAATDSANNFLSKTDTIKFVTKRLSEYGTVIIRFTNLEMGRRPILQFVQNNLVMNSYVLAGKEWSSKIFEPGEYEIRILYDENNNGKWDPGDYQKKKQPEKVIAIDQKLNIRADWDNESDVVL
jgi:hypothetical protein